MSYSIRVLNKIQFANRTKKLLNNGLSTVRSDADAAAPVRDAGTFQRAAGRALRKRRTNRSAPRAFRGHSRGSQAPRQAEGAGLTAGFRDASGQQEAVNSGWVHGGTERGSQTACQRSFRDTRCARNAPGRKWRPRDGEGFLYPRAPRRGEAPCREPTRGHGPTPSAMTASMPLLVRTRASPRPRDAVPLPRGLCVNHSSLVFSPILE